MNYTLYLQTGNADKFEITKQNRFQLKTDFCGYLVLDSKVRKGNIVVAIMTVKSVKDDDRDRVEVEWNGLSIANSIEIILFQEGTINNLLLRGELCADVAVEKVTRNKSYSMEFHKMHNKDKWELFEEYEY